MSKIECLGFRSHNSGILQGFAKLHVPAWGVEIDGCKVFQKEGQRWLKLPDREYKNAEGETKWAPTVRFVEKRHQDLFSTAALKAVDEWCAENAAPVEPEGKIHMTEVLGDSLPF